MRDVLFKAFSQIEPSTEIEPIGLILSRPLLRPADVLTGASGLTGCLAALDVGICSPNARGAGEDCLQTMLNRKNERMIPFESELDQAGVHYKPIIFSCYGRPHADAIKLISSLARRMARRSGKEAHVVEQGGTLAEDVWNAALSAMAELWTKHNPQESAQNPNTKELRKQWNSNVKKS